MRVLILASGGKDSSLASWWAMCRGWDVVALVTASVLGEDSWMFQLQGTEMAQLQAEAQGVGWMRIDVSGVPEREVDELEEALRPIISGERDVAPAVRGVSSSRPIDAIVCGALASEYQRRRIERMAERLGVISYCPLWHHEPGAHMRDLIECGFEMILVSVSCEGLTEEWLGRVLDDYYLRKLESLSLEYRFSIDGEGGEYETIIIAGPHMNKRIEIVGRPVWHGARGEFQIDSAKLI
jgi:ABC transporter with metal-binding/Fe-S-binding domain ATP-binding protein